MTEKLTDELVTAALAEVQGLLDDVDDATRERLIRSALAVYVNAETPLIRDAYRTVLANDIAHARDLSIDRAWALAKKILAAVVPALIAKIPPLAAAAALFLSSLIEEEPIRET